MATRKAQAQVTLSNEAQDVLRLMGRGARLVSFTTRRNHVLVMDEDETAVARAVTCELLDAGYVKRLTWAGARCEYGLAVKGTKWVEDEREAAEARAKATTAEDVRAVVEATRKEQLAKYEAKVAARRDAAEVRDAHEGHHAHAYYSRLVDVLDTEVQVEASKLVALNEALVAVEKSMGLRLPDGRPIL